MKFKIKPDFQGWATKNDLVCADGLVIKANAFAQNDGGKVPLVFGHDHTNPSRILGHAILENRKEGVYAYCFLNQSKAAKDTKEAVLHGDIDALSIFANRLQKDGRNVTHGCIKEVSVVLSGANPGAFIESALQHNEPLGEWEDEGILFTGDGITISHAEAGNAGQNSKSENSDEGGDDETIQDVLDTLTDKQKAAVGMLLQSIEEDGVEHDDMENDEGGDEMRHYNAFEGDENNEGQAAGSRYLMHSDLPEIMKNIKKFGSFKNSLADYIESNDIVLAHSLDTTGMDVPTATPAPTYGINGIDMLFPDPKTIQERPEMIGRDTSWVNDVMSSVTYTPFKRIKTMFADITEEEARAKGYIKGKQKKEEVFAVLKRVTEPQTIYKKQKLDKDDIEDIEDWDVLAWIRAEMEIMFDEEKARAVLIGDGRLADSEDKIKEDRIRPVVSDVPLFNTTIEVPVGNIGKGMDAATLIDDIVRGMKKYKGTGRPTFYTTEDVITEMLLLKDKVGNRIYKTEQELATALRVSKIVPVEVMEGHKVSGKSLIGVVVNLTDYKIGGGNKPKQFFEDFDIDYNQQKYLLEQRMSGALVKPFAAVTFLASASVNGSGGSGSTPITPPTGGEEGDDDES